MIPLPRSSSALPLFYLLLLLLFRLLRLLLLLFLLLVQAGQQVLRDLCSSPSSLAHTR